MDKIGAGHGMYVAHPLNSDFPTFIQNKGHGGRGKSYRRKTWGKWRSFSTRIRWDHSRTPQPRKIDIFFLIYISCIFPIYFLYMACRGTELA